MDANLPGFPDLRTLWYEEDLTSLRCLYCHQPFVGQGSDALVRTFSLWTTRYGQDTQDSSPFPAHSRLVSLPTTGETLVIYDRHLGCLLNARIEYAAISHVWHTSMSELQNKGKDAPQPQDVRQLAFELPSLIARNLGVSLDDPGVEIWHDYISVPQWSVDLRDPILLVIHRIFGSAKLTVVHLDDVTPNTINALLHGSTSSERLSGLTRFCNARWFGRVWTAMEFVRSQKVRIMDAENNLHSDPSSDALLIPEMNVLWGDEIRRHESVHHLEEEVGIGHNLVPWNLGPLLEARDPALRNFGMAFALLARRNCRDDDDFLFALHGIVTGESVTKLEGSWENRYLGIARRCLEAGDYTPLLVTPDFGDDMGLGLKAGYNHVCAFSMGQKTHPATFHAESLFQDGAAVLKMQKVGLVSMINRPVEMEPDPMESFACHAMFVLDSTGPDVDAFVQALAGRLYWQHPDVIHQSLSQGNRRQELQSFLHTFYNSERARLWPFDGVCNAWWLADALSLSNCPAQQSESRLDFCHSHGGTLHLAACSFLAGVTCTTCHTTAVYRAALYAPPAEVRGAVAYRIPGLAHIWSFEDGICLLVKDDGRIVGRMIWATPACACEQLELIRLKVPSLPRPKKRVEFLEEQ